MMSDVDTLTLADFLLARIGDDHVFYGLTREIPADIKKRLLADCEAKRRIVVTCKQDIAIYKFKVADEYDNPDAADESRAETAHGTLRLLALPYADHPDFDPQWRIE